MNMKRVLIGLLAALCVGQAVANTCPSRAAGATSQSITLTFIDATTGIPTAGIAYNAAGMDIQYTRSQAAPTAVTEATQTTSGAYSSGGLVSTILGDYRFDIPDAALAAGVPEVAVRGVATGYVTLPCVIKLETSVPQTGDSYARLGAPAGASVSADIAALLVQVANGKLGIIETGTAQAGASGNIQLASAVSRADNFLNCSTVALTGGTGAGQSRVIDVWTSATDTGTVTVNWTTAPSSDSTYVVFQTPCGSSEAVATTVWASASRTLTALDEDDTVIDLNTSYVGGVTVFDEDLTAIDVNATTMGTVVTATNLTNLPTIPTAWITANGIETDAIGAAEIADNAINAGAIASDAITDAKVASDVTIASITGNVGGNVTGSVGSVASGGITATSIATDAIGAAEIAADAGVELAQASFTLQRIITGTCSTGSTTTCEDPALTQAAASQLEGRLICFDDSFCALITTFSPTTEVVTTTKVAPSTRASKTFTIFPATVE